MKPVLLIAFALLLFGCNTELDKTGPYQGDKVLFDADQTISTAYTALDVFVTWEKQNAGALSSQPEIHAAAERVRKSSREWFRSALIVRDAYEKNPTPENRASLANAIGVIRSAIEEAAKYMQSNPTKTVTDFPQVQFDKAA